MFTVLLQEEIRGKQKIIHDRTKELDRHQEENKELEAFIVVKDREITKLRAEYGTSKQILNEIEDEVETVRKKKKKRKIPSAFH
jgi:chromosome segregation ATPase